MTDEEIVGKKIYYREAQLGKVVSTKHVFGNKQIAVIELTTKNNFKAIPLSYIEAVADQLQFKGDRMIIDRFPKLSSREIENNPDKVKDALTEHYGEPQYWDKPKTGFSSGKDDAYMGSSQITDQEPVDNESLKGKVDFDSIRHGKDKGRR